MGRIMTRPKKLRDNRMDTEKDERVLPAPIAEVVKLQQEYLQAEDLAAVVKELLTPKRYSPPNCSMCAALRPKPELSYVSVYHTRQEDGYILRYCKCGFCNNTFKDSEKL